MATTKLFLDTRRSKSGSPSILKVAITHKRVRTLISLDVRLQPHEWDDLTQKIVNHPDSFRLNAYVGEVKNKVDAIIVELMHRRELSALSASGIKRICEEELHPEEKAKKEDTTTFLYRFSKYSERVSAGTRRTFDHTLNRLAAFLGADLKKLRFEDVTVEWLVKFDNFMAVTAPSRNSRNIHFRNMRTVFNDAIEDGITSHYPFRRFKIKNVVTANRDLTVEELRRLIFFDCEECAVKYRDYFLLMFFLMGINCVDFCNLKEMRNWRIEYHRQKTKHFFSIKVEPEAAALIQKYRGKDWLLDILDHWSSDEFFRRKMNKHLQKIGPVDRSGLGGKKTYVPMFPQLTTYYARHTWASIAASLDIPFETIAAGLGHEYGNKITNIYIHYDNRKVDAANRKVIDWVLYGKRDGKVIVKPGTPKFFGIDRREAETLGLLPQSSKIG